MLPIQPFADQIVRTLIKAGSLVLTAPTGSGKSTQAPRFLLEKRQEFPGKVLVLEPRRLAARSLAGRVAFETSTRLGEQVGYQVRFESRCGPQTRLTFQTYGIFIQQMLGDPALPGISAVVLDEFHERTLEVDLALAWLKALIKKRRPDLRLLIMSATIDAGELNRYLPGSESLDVPGRLFPVDVRHLPPAAREGPPESALRALQLLAQDGLDGSVLVFMPGYSEIRRTLARLGPWCREQGLALHALHGSMELSEQQNVLAAESRQPRVIVATNVAETSLTIPGVTMVIDSGLHRIAAYNTARGINTLYLSRISRQNAAQRTGRAGRIAPGRCIRLWPKSAEASMPQALAPEILRLELSSLYLQAASLPEPVDWLTPPKEDAWSAADRALHTIAATDAPGRITVLGRALLRYPVAPRLAAILEAARSLGHEAFERARAMIAVFESASERRPNETADLYALAGELMAGEREAMPWEAFKIFQQLKALSGKKPAEAPVQAQEGTLAELWLKIFSDRLAVRIEDGLVYGLADGSKALLPIEKSRAPRLILALDIRQRAGAGQVRQVSVPVFLPCEPETVEKVFPGESSWQEVCEFDGKQQRVVKEERLMFRGLALARRQAPAQSDRKAAAEIWAEKFASGALKHPGWNEAAEQLAVRIKLARRLYPGRGFPGLDEDDWKLIYGEACAGRNSLKEIERVALETYMGRYLGATLMEFLDRVLPVRRRLPSGRTGRFTYFEAKPPELAARVGDFLKMSGKLSLCEGRLNVVFDILAPNQRTVQKTDDLASFWKNTYPKVKSELRRRYPKHPWP